MPLELSISKVESISVATLKGTIVAGNDKDLLIAKAEELLNAGETRIILDLGQVNYVDSTGIGALVHIHTTAERKGAAVKLLNLTKRIHDVLQITRLSTVFGIYSDLQKAIESFEGTTGG
jgi:anti-sigma B factor antagonist